MFGVLLSRFEIMAMVTEDMLLQFIIGDMRDRGFTLLGVSR